jgi:hypothetical protein
MAQNMSFEGIRSSLWSHLITEEYNKGRMSFEQLIPFITAQNIPHEKTRSSLWRDLIMEEYNKGRMSFQQLKPFITAQNIPDKFIRSVLKDLSNPKKDNSRKFKPRRY